MPPRAPDLASFQHRDALDPKATPFQLSRFDPAAKPFSTGAKTRDKQAVEALAGDIDRLQDLFYADRRFKLLIVLQGTDTSGKDGTLRGVFSRTSPLGVHTVGWKAPSLEEAAHDYLWRIHHRVPARGEVTIFNRSHYEDVLVPWVKGAIDADEVRRRYAQINDFERMLSETGTVVLKFLLHISKDEQRKRLQARLDDPTKHWKFEGGDIETRRHWDAFQRAYSDVVAATGTPWAPWTIVPADSKTHRNLMVATVVKRTLEGLSLRYPPADPDLPKTVIE